MSKRPIPEATVGRLPVYLRALVEMAEAEYQTLRSSAKHYERTMSAHVRYLIKRELVAR